MEGDGGAKELNCFCDPGAGEKSVDGKSGPI